MASKDVKANLKEARSALNKQEYEIVLQKCQTVLEADPRNYNAYVFIGVAAQELNKSSQSVEAFKKAIDIMPTQKLAWQGLAAFYEKNNTEEDKRALVNVYPKLIEFAAADNEDEKLLSLYGKYAQLSLEMGNLEKSLELLSLQLKICTSPVMECQVHAAILNACTAQTALIPSDRQEIFDSSLQEYFKSEHAVGEVKIKFLLLYVKHLCKKQEYDKALLQVHEICSNSDGAEILEIVGQCYLDIAYRTSYSLETLDGYEKVFETLKEERPESHVLQMMSLLKYYCSQDLDKIIEFFNNEIIVKDPYECELCVRCCLLLHQYNKIILYSLKGLHFCKDKNFDDSLLHSLKMNWLIGRFYTVSKEEAVNDVLSLEELMASFKDKKMVFLWLFCNHAKSKNVEQAKMSLSKYGNHLEITERLGYDGIISKMEGKWKEAYMYLSESTKELPENVFFLLELALVCRELGEYQDSVSYIVQGLKLDAYNPELYFELGQHFMLQEELEKAGNCFRNAFTVFQESEKIGIALSDVYEQLNDEEANLNLLTTVCDRADGVGAKWAWLKLGLHHLKYSNAKAAIKALQASLRIDPLDSHCWEALADAYKNHGSYTSALKSYNRALELNPESVYCSYQMATIKQLLGEYAASAIDYQCLLENDPNYVPALKGYGEVLYLQAKQHIQLYCHGLAKDLAEKSVGVLSKGLHLRPDLICLWKLLGDVCLLSFYLPSEICSFDAPNSLLESLEMGVSPLMKLDLLRLSSKCYSKAVRLMPNCAALWHDMGVSYYQTSKVLNGDSEEMRRSFQSLKKAVCLDAKSTLLWNSLGVVATEMKNYPLAQHCFIKAIKCDEVNASAWTNLGALYLIHDSHDQEVLRLANRAFSIAQSIDPSYLNSWIGQATIAELVEHEDAMDLFRHSTNIGNHDESAVGYASWVIDTLLLHENPENDHYKYWVENLAAIPIACDCMARFTDRHQTCAQGLNMYGLLLEKDGMYHSAAKAFERSLKLLENSGDSDSETDLARCNYARILLSLGNYNESCQQYLKIKIPSLASQCGMALACYKSQLWEKSLEAYEAGLDWFAETSEERSQLLVAMAMTYFQQKDIANTKTLLLESSQMESPSIHGLLALCALGILRYETEHVLAETVLKVITAYERDCRYCALVTFLKSAFYSVQGNLTVATGAICKAVYEQPANPVLWSFLSHHLMVNQTNTHAINRCALTAEELSRSSTAKSVADNCSEVSGQCLIALSSAMTGNASTCLRSAQKAIHLNPGGPIGWCSLMIPAIASVNSSKSDVEKLDVGWLQKLVMFISKQVRLSVSVTDKVSLLRWLLKNKIFFCIQVKDFAAAKLTVKELQNMDGIGENERVVLGALGNHLQDQDFGRIRKSVLQMAGCE